MVELAPGVWLGDWILEESLGVGGFAQVHAARHAQDGRAAAVKVVTDPRMAERLRGDPRVLQLDHPHVVTTLAEHLSHDPPFLVLERAAGGSLRDALEGGPLPPERVVAVIRDVAAALDHAHGHGVLHLDVKPENVLLQGGGDGRALLTDFGVAGGAESNVRQSLPVSELQTGLVGTRDYAAPEVRYGDGDIDRRADVYGLAVLAFELLTGRLPLGLDRPSELAPVPPAVDQVFADALTRDPARRTLSAGAFARALGSALGSAPAREPDDVATPARAGRPGWLALLLVLVAAASFGAVLLAQRSSPQGSLPPALATVLEGLRGPVGVLTPAAERPAVDRLVARSGDRPRLIAVPFDDPASLWERPTRSALLHDHGCERVLQALPAASDPDATWFVIDLLSWEYRDASPSGDPGLDAFARDCAAALRERTGRRPVALLGKPTLDRRLTAALVRALRGVTPVRATAGFAQRFEGSINNDLRRTLSASLAVQVERVDGVRRAYLLDLSDPSCVKQLLCESR